MAFQLSRWYIQLREIPYEMLAVRWDYVWSSYAEGDLISKAQDGFIVFIILFTEVSCPTFSSTLRSFSRYFLA